MKTKAVLVRSLVERAMRETDGLNVQQVAELNEAAAIVLQPFDREKAQIARHTAGLFRQAENQQLQLTLLLRS